MSIKKRFIAGAVCTQCQALDRTVQCISADDEWIECVECGHTERRPTAASIAQASAIQPAAENAGVSVVKFLNKPL